MEREGWEGELHMVVSEVKPSLAEAQGLGMRPLGLTVQPSSMLNCLCRRKTHGRKPARSVPTWVNQRRERKRCNLPISFQDKALMLLRRMGMEMDNQVGFRLGVVLTCATGMRAHVFWNTQARILLVCISRSGIAGSGDIFHLVPHCGKFFPRWYTGSRPHDFPRGLELGHTNNRAQSCLQNL